MALYDFLDFPPELCCKPSALIGLCGLDIQNNPFHRNIWEVFRTSQERSSVNFKLFSLTHCFPPIKPKRTTYDCYIPKGLLKRNWMRKRMLEIPSVMALLFDLNWDDTNADKLKLECVAQLQGLRTSLGNHGTKIVVILIQKNAPLPEDSKAAERAKSLCSACDIETKQLYVLPHGDHLQGYISRLENALHDLAQNYYHQEIKQVKQHKDQLNKTTQQYLYVRHQFKMGFLSELRADNRNARKYYDLAYSYLKEVRISDTNILEVKLIAGFISYKLSYLMFKLNQPRDAISNFKLHIEYYKNKIGCKELYFEHLSWLSKQYSAFGDIFNEAVKEGLNAVQTQHPGFYYQLAAQYCIDRKNACEELCKDITTYPRSDPLMGLSTLEFYGQRPWRAGQLSAEPLNPGLELEGIAALKYKETLVNHSGIIIRLLGNAISQFKTYRCPRMRLQLVVQMADEYFSSKEYGQALTLFSHILWDYKDEKWWLLLSTLLTRALSCAYVAANVQDYINFSLEALGPLAKFNPDRRKKIFSNLVAVLNMKHPEPEPEVPAESVVSARNSWEASISSDKPVVTTIDVSTRSCIDAKARFTKSFFTVDEVITVEIFIRSSFPHPTEFLKLSIVMNIESVSSEFTIPSKDNTLVFEQGIVKKLNYEFKCSASDVGKTIRISQLILTMGFTKERTAILKFNLTQANNEISVDKTSDEFHLSRYAINEPMFDKIENLIVSKLVAVDSKVKVQVTHNSPALLSEWYPIKVSLLNEEDLVISEAVIEVKLQTAEDATVEQTAQLCLDLKNCVPLSTVQVTLRNILQKENRIIIVYLRGHRIGERNLLIKWSYCFHGANNTLSKSFSEKLVRVPIIQPFEVSAEPLSLKFEPIDKCFSRNPFILSVSVRILSPWPIQIHHSSINPSLSVKFCNETVSSYLAKALLNQGESGSDMFPLIIEEFSEQQPLAIGTYILQWSREGSAEVTSSSVTMPTITCEPTILGIEMNLPAHGWVRKPMKLEYNLCNHSNDLLQLDLLMESSDAFMFAGQKQVLMRLLPGSVKKLKYNLYPLFSGLVALPRLVFRSTSDAFLEQLNQIIDRNILSHIYVMPQEKLALDRDPR